MKTAIAFALAALAGVAQGSIPQEISLINSCQLYDPFHWPNLDERISR